MTVIEAEKIIIRPIISEKSYAQIDHHRYTFEWIRRRARP